MEKISAACAMGWSIELEKGLRSRKSGHPIESINLIGPRLKQWSKESQPTLAVYNMYRLVPGEDRLFADAILLRVAAAFVSGDRDMKISIVRVFLSILRHCKGKDGQAQGIFSNMDKENRLEFLRRVKAVLTSDSVESRALALVLLGCCAEIAKNVAEIQFAISSSLFSSHVLEVKASLFAAGCFSDVSDGFGSVFLESLLKLMNSPKILPSLKIAGARTFSKMGGSVSFVMKAYKAGAELVTKTLEEDILGTMLISLTKLSLKASILISDQIGLLSSFLSQETNLHMQATVLKCMHNIGEEAACFLPPGAFPFEYLFRMLDEPSMPSALRCEVLLIFLKMLEYGLPDMLFIDPDKFMKLSKYVEEATCAPILSMKLLAFQILVNISDKLKERRDELILEIDAVTFSTGVVSSISDQMTLLVRLVPGGTSSSEVEQELGSMLKLLLLLVENHSELGSVILDKLYFVIKIIKISQNMPSSALQDSEIHKAVNTEANQKFSTRVLMFYIYRFLVAFLEILGDFGAITSELVCKLKQLVSFVCDSNLFDCSTHTFFTLLLHSLVNWSSLSSVNKSGNSVQGASKSSNKLFESEALIQVCAKNMLLGGDNWCAYKAGRYAACEGEWNVASFIFQHLEARVQSDGCLQWLKFLAQFSYSENNIKVLLQQASCCLPLDHVLVPAAVDNSLTDTVSSEYIEKLVGAFTDVSSSDKVLEAISLETQTLCFQRWFISLRLKVLLVLVDILKLLNGCLVSEVGQDSNRHTGGSDVIHDEPSFQKMKDIMSSLVELSTRLANVAEEYDLVSSSFVDLDSKSLKVISALAFSCSVLAFCTDMTSFISNSRAFGYPTKEPDYHQDVIIKDLAMRLWHIDSGICMDLMSMSKECKVHERSLHFLPRSRIPKVSYVSEDILSLCRSSVRQLIGLQNECFSVKNDDPVWHVYKDFMQLLMNIIQAWMQIPFQVPKYFFRVRPTVGSLLLCQSAGCKKQAEICVSQGSHLALNLSLQLKNVTSDVCSRFSKIHCILSCKPSFMGTRCNEQLFEEGWTGYQASEIDTLMHLNKKLQCHVMKLTSEFMNCGDRHGNRDTIETCVCFETNGTAQGFSTCLLDVSAFPVGSYRIHWHSGGIDRQGAYWSFLPLSHCPQFSVTEVESSSEKR